MMIHYDLTLSREDPLRERNYCPGCVNNSKLFEEISRIGNVDGEKTL